MVIRLSMLMSPVKLKGGGTLLRDHLRMYVRGGRGGQGLERYNGIGGDGGDVLLEASERVTLERLAFQNPSRRFIAGPGQDSRKFQLIGDKGENKVVRVPVGITVKTDAGQLIRALHNAGDQLLVATGGLGGCASNNYRGVKPKPYIIRLDLKLLADVGLVGFPNAGKSTFLQAVSQAKPRIASYPFTTVRPQLGVIEYDDGRQISVADLPGLIEGAYLNVGMGHHFLKHVERTFLLLFVIDITGFKLNLASPFRSAFDTFLLLTKEIELYMPELLNKPCVLCLNKMDMPKSTACLHAFMERFHALSEEGSCDSITTLPAEVRPSRIIAPLKIWPISAKKRMDIQPVVSHLRQAIDQLDEEKRKRNHVITDVWDVETVDPVLF
uniref:OBG-type G domain-containing protein n=1 Tax=Trichuris muris TaxID=70415 RepID=A0A5S6QLY2_TRIMR